MTGEARNLDRPPAFAAAIEGAVLRLKDVLSRWLGAAQARFRPAPRPAPGAGFVGASVIPTVRYRDVPKAVDWLCRAFGMQVHRIVADPGGAPCYAELTVGSGMLMVAPIEDTPFGKLMVQPDEIGGVETQVCYLCVGNARAHYKRAKAAGAVILLDPDDEANRGRGYSCRDPEGHVWNFGTYDPWAGQSPAPAAASWRWRPGRLPGGLPGQLPGGLPGRLPGAFPCRLPGRLQQGLAALLVLAIAGMLLDQLVPQPSARAGAAAMAQPPAEASPPPPAIDEPPLQVAAITTGSTTRLEEPTQGAIETAERMAAAARAELAEIRGAFEKAEREAATARAQLDELQRARQAAELATAEVRSDLAAAQESAERARAEAARERARRLAAVRAAASARRRAAVSAVRHRARWSRTWCYDSNHPSPAPSGAVRLIGFCT